MAKKRPLGCSCALGAASDLSAGAKMAGIAIGIAAIFGLGIWLLKRGTGRGTYTSPEAANAPGFAVGARVWRRLGVPGGSQVLLQGPFTIASVDTSGSMPVYVMSGGSRIPADELVTDEECRASPTCSTRMGELRLAGWGPRAHSETHGWSYSIPKPWFNPLNRS